MTTRTIRQERKTKNGDAVSSPSRRKVLQAALAGSFAVSLAGCDGSDDSGSTDYSSTITDARAAILKAMADSDTSSVSVALVEGNRLVWQEAFGVVDRINNVPASIDTLYNIGSVSKVFVATAVMILVDRGLVDLDAPVTTYIRDFQMLSPAYAQITVRMLLSHSSGFPGANYRNIFTFGPISGYARDTQAVLAGVHLKHEPGELAVYCNDGFTMAERVVEEVSGKAYAAFVADEILSPLGMTRSRYPLEFFPEGSFAHAYIGSERQKQEFVLAFGTGGLSSTPTDMMRFAMMFINGGDLDGRRILSRNAVKQMGIDQTTNLILNPTPVWKWGLGWDSVEQAGMHEVGLTCWQKNGGTAFYGSELFVLPNESLAVMITGTSLRYGSSKLAERILLHALQASRRISVVPAPLPSTPPPVIPASDADLNGLAGGYYANNERVMKVVQGADRTLSLLTWSAGQWTAMASGLQLRDDNWFAADGVPLSYRSESIGPYRYVAMRALGGYGHYHVSLPLGQRLQDAPPPLPAAWLSRLGQSWLLVNEDESSVMVALESPVFKLEEIPELPGYIQVGGSQLVLPNDDTRTRQFLKIPANFGRDLNELIVYSHLGEEWLKFGGHRYRPLNTVLSVGVGTHAVQVDSEGYTQWRRLTNASSVQITGSRAWRLYDAQWNFVKAGENGSGTDLPAGGASYLMIFGAPNSQVNLTLA